MSIEAAGSIKIQLHLVAVAMSLTFWGVFTGISNKYTTLDYYDLAQPFYCFSFIKKNTHIQKTIFNAKI